MLVLIQQVSDCIREVKTKFFIKLSPPDKKVSLTTIPLTVSFTAGLPIFEEG